MSGLRKQSAVSVSSITSNSQPQAFIAPEPASITSCSHDGYSQNECSIPEEKDEVCIKNFLIL